MAQKKHFIKHANIYKNNLLNVNESNKLKGKTFECLKML